VEEARCRFDGNPFDCLMQEVLELSSWRLAHNAFSHNRLCRPIPDFLPSPVLRFIFGFHFATSDLTMSRSPSSTTSVER
jgi:hypothetical protein